VIRRAGGIRWHGRWGIAVAAAMSLGAVACGGGNGDAVEIGLVNRTGVPVGVYANGGWMGTYPVDAEISSVPVRGRGGPPWTVEVRDPADNVLGSFLVDEAAVAAAEGGEATVERFDAPCGTVWTWLGSRTEEHGIDADAAPRSSSCR
jgi:hypothetical protein